MIRYDKVHEMVSSLEKGCVYNLKGDDGGLLEGEWVGGFKCRIRVVNWVRE